MKFEEVIRNLATQNAVKRSANITAAARIGPSKEDLLAKKKLFLDEKRIRREYYTSDEDFDFRRFILFLLLNEEDYSIKSDLKEITNKIKEFKNRLLKNEKYIHVEDDKIGVYNVVLEAIKEDRKISKDELNVLEKLRKKIGITLFQHWIFRIKNDFFDEINKIDSMANKLKEHLHQLEKKGLVFYVIKGNEKYYTIPEEIANQLKKIFEMELSFYKFEALLNNSIIKNVERRNFLKSKGIDSYGTKDELNKKIIFNWLNPSEFLGFLTLDSLSEIATKLGIKKSGNKKEIVRRIIEHYNEIYIPSARSMDERERYYMFYEDLANRNQSKLIKKGIITKGEEIGKKFEKATEYLFEKILGFKVVSPKIKGRLHGVKADGKAIKNGDFIVWDCKTKDARLKISTSERRQFIDYINEYKKVDKGKFLSFLIITSEIDDIRNIRRKLLEIKKETDIDISVVRASDLKKFAEEVKKTKREVDLKPFYQTKVIDYEDLKTFITHK